MGDTELDSPHFTHPDELFFLQVSGGASAPLAVRNEELALLAVKDQDTGLDMDEPFRLTWSPKTTGLYRKMDTRGQFSGSMASSVRGMSSLLWGGCSQLSVCLCAFPV